MVGFNLLLPLPFCRPGILICKMTKGPIGRTVISTISAMLIILLIAPAYDLAMLHRFKGFQGTEISSPERRLVIKEFYNMRSERGLSSRYIITNFVELWHVALWQLSNLVLKF